MATKKIYWALRSRRWDGTTPIQRLTEYAHANHVDESTVRGWIAQRRIVAYRIKGRWWVDPVSRFRVPLADRR